MQTIVETKMFGYVDCCISAPSVFQNIILSAAQLLDSHNHFMALLDFVLDYPGEPTPER